MSVLSLLVPFHPAPATLCNHKAKAGKVSERGEERVGPVPFCSVPSRSGHPVYICNHKANKAGKVSEKVEEEKQKPENSAELTLATFSI